MQLSIIFFWLSVFTSCVRKPKQPAGGYYYPTNLSSVDTNNYVYPIKDILSTRDSFEYAYYERYWNQGYGEPNLSIKPQEHEVFRLTYKSAFSDAVIITLYETRIVAKQWVKGDPYPEYDSTKLNAVEKELYQILFWGFPIQESIRSGRKSLDSIARLYPEILDVNYYSRLLDKCLVPNKDPLEYTIHEVPISRSKYYQLLSRINATGYWTMPYEITCEDTSTDGFGIALEANTKSRYNIVFRFGCMPEEIPFLKVCKELIKAAQLKRELKILSNV